MLPLLSSAVQASSVVQPLNQQCPATGPHDRPSSGNRQQQTLCVGGGVCALPQRPSRGQAVRTSASAASCGLLVVASGAYCPPRPRSGRLQACASRSKTRRRRSSSGGGDGDDDGSSDWWGSDWGPFDDASAWFFYSAGGGGNNNNNGWGGSGGGGGGGHSWDSAAGGDAFHQAVFHCTWLWQLVCAASLLRSLYFLLFTEATASVAAQAVGAASVTAGCVSRIALAC